MSRQIEMTWKCSACSARNLGRFKKCPQCGKAKGDEPFDMPLDTSKAVSVTDAALLKMALDGPDWRCAYCDSSQRAADKSCASCGASALEAEAPEADDADAETKALLREIDQMSEGQQPAFDADAQVAAMRPKTRGAFIGVGVVVGFALLTWAGSAVVRWNKNRPRDATVTVSEVHWQRTIEVERWAARTQEGFKENMPTEALAVKSLGQREHHQEQVYDHTDTEHYTVQVPDGYRTESYSERVACGETCSGSERSCREVCKSNKNGFATCQQVCSGGGRSCRTKYCNETRTRQVAKTRSEDRTRQVKKYRSEPRFAEAFTWQHWEWAHERSLKVSGHDVTLRWPEPEAPVKLADHEKERDSRTEAFHVTLAWGDRTLAFSPDTAEAFEKFPPGTSHTLHTENGQYILDGQLLPRAVASP